MAELITTVKVGFFSYHTVESMARMAEGIVARPIEPLYDRRGKRVIIKLKTKDFKGVEK